MKKNPIEAVLGFFVLIFTGYFLYFAFSKIDVEKIEGYTLYASFDKIGGLEVGADVRINGIKVGSVADIKLNMDTFMADVSMVIKDNIRIPDNSQIIISDSGIMGGKYVRIMPTNSNQYLTNGKYFKFVESYKSLEDKVGEFIFLSTKDDVQ